jgi:uncharacterized protein YndB with AHSA1/START domain
MPDIFQHLTIKGSPAAVFGAISTPAGLDAWWTKTCAGAPTLGAEYRLGFGPGYDWRARVSRCQPDTEFELEISEAHPDWQGSRIGFQLIRDGDSVELRFHHTGWPADNDHYRISCYCWAMYLRLLKRYVERGEIVPYEVRLEV